MIFYSKFSKATKETSSTKVFVRLVIQIILMLQLLVFNAGGANCSFMQLVVQMSVLLALPLHLITPSDLQLIILLLLKDASGGFYLYATIV